MVSLSVGGAWVARPRRHASVSFRDSIPRPGAYARKRDSTSRAPPGERSSWAAHRRLLGEHWRRREDEVVFCHPARGPARRGQAAGANLRPALRRAGSRSGAGSSTTSLTHEPAACSPMAYVRLKAGHSQSAITERYLHAAEFSSPTPQPGEGRIFAGMPGGKGRPGGLTTSVDPASTPREFANWGRLRAASRGVSRWRLRSPPSRC